MFDIIIVIFKGEHGRVVQDWYKTSEFNKTDTLTIS